MKKTITVYDLHRVNGPEGPKSKKIALIATDWPSFCVFFFNTTVVKPIHSYLTRQLFVVVAIEFQYRRRWRIPQVPAWASGHSFLRERRPGSRPLLLNDSLMHEILHPFKIHNNDYKLQKAPPPSKVSTAYARYRYREIRVESLSAFVWNTNYWIFAELGRTLWKCERLKNKNCKDFICGALPHHFLLWIRIGIIEKEYFH